MWGFSLMHFETYTQFLSRDDVFETLQEVNFSEPMYRLLDFERLDSAVKREFTRLYNRSSHKSQQLVRDDAIVGLKKKPRRMKPTQETNENDSVDSDAEHESDVEMKQLIEKKALRGKAKKRKAPSKASKPKRKRKAKNA